MANFLNSIIEANGGTSLDTPAEDKPVETPKVEDQPAPVEDKPAPEEDKPAPVEDQPAPEEDKPAPEEDKPAPVEDKPKKDYSQFTKEEKAEFAFKRQLEKQKSKFADEVKDMKESFTKQFDALKAELAKQSTPARIKTRADFPEDAEGDKEYVDYLTELKVKDILAERDAAAAKERADQEERQKEMDAANERQREAASAFQANCQAAFPDVAQYKAFSGKVQRGLDNGLAELLDQAPDVRDYLFGNPDGPVVLNEMLTRKESFVRIMSKASRPLDAIVELHDMARELKAAPAPAPAPAPGMPHLGKPGSKGGSSVRSFGSDKDILKFIRSVH